MFFTFHFVFLLALYFIIFLVSNFCCRLRLLCISGEDADWDIAEALFVIEGTGLGGRNTFL